MANLVLELILFSSLFLISLGFQCGIRKIKVKKLIVNGEQTSPGDWPWHVAIYHRDSSTVDRYACGGTLIHEIYVLTADHCVRDDSDYVLNHRNVFVRMGLHNLKNLGQKGFQQHNLRKIHSFDVSSGLRNDIAILELHTVARFDDYVQPACINLVEDLTKQMGTAIGWGLTEKDDVSQDLKASLMPVISITKCLESDREAFGPTLDSTVFCAGYRNGTTVCNGDSGGGIHFERNGVFYIGGLVSFTVKRDYGNACKIESYAVFTNVYNFLPWIRDITSLKYLVEAEEIAAIETEYPNYLPRSCGRQLVNRYIRGTRAKLYEFPWMAILLGIQSSGEIYAICSGTVINKHYILTSAYCTYKSSPVIVRVGEYDFLDSDCNEKKSKICAPPVQDLGIASIVQHPEYDDDSYQNNIAMIRTKEEISFEEHIQPICLPISQSQRMKKPQRYIATGWGHTNYPDGILATVLHKATLPAVDLEECRKNQDPKWYTQEGVFCAGWTGTQSMCIGDLGGPLGLPEKQDNGPRFIQYGILSVSLCDNGSSIYTNVAKFMNWIEDNMKP